MEGKMFFKASIFDTRDIAGQVFVTEAVGLPVETNLFENSRDKELMFGVSFAVLLRKCSRYLCLVFQKWLKRVSVFSSFNAAAFIFLEG